jgi:tetratricopeptide (TPR) repeat protein
MQIERHAAEVDRKPRHADVRYRYGVLLRAEDRTGEAMEQFKIASEINPTYVQALVKLGICRQELGQNDEAIETFKQVLEIKSQYVDMHYRLGLLYTDRRQFDLAVQEMEAASEGAPDNTQIRASLALSLQNMGLMDRAAATWRSLWQMHQAATKA